MPPEYQILRKQMTDTPKHTINTCRETYMSCAAVLVVAACSSLLTHIYSVCVFPIICVGTALRGDTACTARNFSSNFSGFGRQTKFSTSGVKFLDVRKFQRRRHRRNGATSGNFVGDVTNFCSRRRQILFFTNAYLSSTYKKHIFITK